MDSNLKPYEEYKETEYDWLGSVPRHWKEQTVRSITKLSSERNGNRDDLELLSVYREYGVIRKSSRDDNHNVESQDLSNYKFVDSGYLVLNKMKMWQGSLGVSRHRGIVSPAYIVCKLTGDLNHEYIHYLMRSAKFKTIYNRISYGVRVGQWDMRYDDFKNIKLFLPPIAEQNQIVKYLDYQLAKINKFIQAKKKLINVLNEQKQVIINEVTTKGTNPNVKLKPSGIEWIEDIPVNWKTSQTKRIFREKNRPYKGGKETQLSLSQKDGLIPSENMTERSLQTSTYDNWKITLPGDLVLNRFKAHLGVFFTANLRGIVTFHYGVFEPILELETKYYEYLFHSNAYKCIFAGRSNGMTVGLQNLSNQNFYNVYTIIPPLNEQKEIVAYIDLKHMEINKAISKIQKEIDLITEYKSSLISDVVTGQVDVRGIDVDFNLENEMHIEVLDEDSFEMEEVLEGEECEV